MIFDHEPQYVSSESLITVLGVVYAHKTTAQGDLYLTRHGMRYADLLEVENWYDRHWFSTHSERLTGTSAVFRVPTKIVQGRSLDLVVKNCRVGEEIPGDTKTLLEFLNADFNSPWEEFSLTMELREGKFGDPAVSIQTQEPLAIYVPSEKMQRWQSGRSIDRLRRVKARHPGIDVDILKQYKLVYGWIYGRDLVECFDFIGASNEGSIQCLMRCTKKSIAHLEIKGFSVADMKASHIIISDKNVKALFAVDACGGDGAAFLESLIDGLQYSVIDYELLIRTPSHNKEVYETRRRVYLNDQRDRLTETPLPPHLDAAEIMGVPYVYGHTESTGGRLWVVGRNSELFDYFLPERWRRTHSWRLSECSEIFYTLTKDHVHLVWKISRVGETPQPNSEYPYAAEVTAYGYNSPFEEAAIAHDLTNKGIGTVYIRAIYRTGSVGVEPCTDIRRYLTHAEITSPDGAPILENGYNYISLRGYFNGPDAWVAAHDGALCRPVDLANAAKRGIISSRTVRKLLNELQDDLYQAGYDGTFLLLDDILLAVTPQGTLLSNERGSVDVRICNFELIRRRP